jgi:hypothetical protein
LLTKFNSPFIQETLPIWSHDGTTVLHGFSGAQLDTELHLTNHLTRDFTPIFVPMSFQTMVWSHTNRYVAISNGIASGDQDIFGEWIIIDLNSEQTFTTEYGQVIQWAQEQDILLINQRRTSQTGMLQNALIIYSIMDDMQTILIESPYPFLFPAWLIDNSFIYYGLLVDNISDIYRISINDGDILQLTIGQSHMDCS